MILLHGTTRQRATEIIQHGPDPRYREPGGLPWEDGFSMYLESGPFHFGSVEDYARGKARDYSDQGGPVILAVDVPRRHRPEGGDRVVPTQSGFGSVRQWCRPGRTGRGLADAHERDSECDMSETLPDRIRRALTVPTRGVLGLVDELLAVACEQDIRLRWQDGQCLVSAPTVDPPIGVPVPKSVVRAVLARIAALCNERVPDSVTPYGGEGEVSVGDTVTVVRARFVNSPEEQSLELCPIHVEPAEPIQGQQLATIDESG